MKHVVYPDYDYADHELWAWTNKTTECEFYEKFCSTTEAVDCDYEDYELCGGTNTTTECKYYEKFGSTR